jgi:hypothetical protein
VECGRFNGLNDRAFCEPTKILYAAVDGDIATRVNC